MNIRKIFKALVYNSDDSYSQNKIATIPNIVTGAGILLTLLYVLMYTTHTWEFLIPVMIALVTLSDFLDGFLARLLNQSSTLGKFLDPLRDRLMLLAVIVNIIFFVEGIYTALIVAILIAESAVVATNAVAKFKYNLIIQVHLWAKLRLLAHMVCAGIITTTLYWPSIVPSWAIIDPNKLLLIMFVASAFAANRYFAYLMSSHK